jgi:two-component system phosphate regulon response regulator PhoB
MARLLVVDEDEASANELVRYLSRHGHEVSTATSARSGIERAQTDGPQLLIISTTLPDLTGTEMCREVRTDPIIKSVPIVLLSPRDDEIDRVVGFEVGADDFLVEPCSLRELELRVRAILRRKPNGNALAKRTTLGALELDPAAHRVAVRGDEVPLSALEFKLLATLYQRRGRVQSRAALLEDVWASAQGVSARTVDACIKRLRSKLGPAGRYIQTVRGVGYRFTGDAHEPPG